MLKAFWLKFRLLSLASIVAMPFLVKATPVFMAYGGHDTLRNYRLYRMLPATVDCPLPPVITPFDIEFDCRNSTVTLYQAHDQVILGPGFESEVGAVFTVQILPSVYGVPQATNLTGTADLDINWTQATSYDENGNVLSDGKQFFDNGGRNIQSQTKEVYRAGASTIYTHVLADQPIRDGYGRDAAVTLPAPIDYADFSYQRNFLLHNTSGAIYNHQNFDISTSGDKTITPDPIWDQASGDHVRGTLAWYYSKENNWEPYTGETYYPYARQTYYMDGTGSEKSESETGDQLRMGMGRESNKFSTPIANELDFYLQVRNKFFATSDLGNLPTNLQNEASAIIARDANGREGIAIQDREGHTVLTARAGTDQVVSNTITIGGPSNPDKNIWYFNLMGSGSPVTITGGSFVLYNMGSEAPVAGFTSGNTLDPGYYKLINTGTTALNLGYNNSYSDISYNFYNQLGQLLASISPEGVKKLYGSGGNGLMAYSTRASIPFISLYTYDVQGRLVASQNPDQGTYSNGAYLGGITTYVYRTDGKIRFAQNPVQAQMTPQAFSYTNYDVLGRPIESGQYQPDDHGIAYSGVASILENTSPGGGLTTGTKTDVTIFLYDVPDQGHGLSSYIQDAVNLGGGVSLTQKYSRIVNNSPAAGDLQSATWYNYDEEGKTVWAVKYINGLGYKTTDYTWDPLGRLVKQVYQAGNSSEMFVHYFDYDPQNGHLWHISTNTVDDKSSARLQATYSYYLYGGLKRVELGDKLQGIDYTYTLDGALKAINNSNKDQGQDPGGDGGNGFSPDAFGEVLDYHIGDYTNDRSGIPLINGVNTASITGNTIPESYVGNIKAISWHTKKPSTIPGITDDPNVNVFQYDNKYQFTENIWGNNLVFGSGPVTFTPTAGYKEKIGNSSGGAAYDEHGNIQYLSRTDASGNPIDQFSYNYLPNTNQLSSVVKDGGQNYATYGYDANGQMISETIGDGSAPSMYLVYDAYGKVAAVYKDPAHQQLFVRFTYDELGHRIKKEDFGSLNQLTQVTYYVGDALYSQQLTSGGTLGPPTAQEYQISGGNGRLGVYYRQLQIYAYQLTDHLGSVRAVIAQSGTTYEVRMYNDYYPFGKVISGGTNDYRYDFQGQNAEKDGETTWNNFVLRMYDSRIGRWLQQDPYGQFFSPYLAMGNDPAGQIDPDGGITQDPTHGTDKCPECRLMPEVVVTPSRPQTMDRDDWDYFVDIGLKSGLNVDQMAAFLNRMNVSHEVMNRFYGSASDFSVNWRQSRRESWKMQGEIYKFVMITMLTEGAGDLLGAGFEAIMATRAAKAAETTAEAASAAKTALTNEELISQAAIRAEKAIGGTGRFAGTEKHSYAFKFLEKYQGIYGNRGLNINEYFPDAGFGKGFLDIRDVTNGVIYDFKFGEVFMSKAQFTKYSNTWNLPIKLVDRFGGIHP